MKNRVKIALLLILVAFTPDAEAQINSGYYGSFHGLEFRAGGVPSRHRVNELKGTGDDAVYKRRLQLIRMSYKLNYSYLVARNIELMAGYEYSRVRTPNRAYYDPSSGNFQYLLQDTKVNKHGVDFHLRFYRKGSITPIGKYYGFGFNYAFLTTPDSLTFIPGTYGGSLKGSNYLTRKNSVTNADTVMLSVPSGNRYQVFSINASIGRNYPLTDQLLLNFNMGVKILGVYSYNSIYTLGRELNDWDDTFSAYRSARVNSDDGELRERVLLESLNMYNRMRLEIGIKYYL